MNVIFSIISMFFIVNVTCQTFDCQSKTKEYRDLFKSKKIESSFAVWSEVKMNCENKSEITYIDGLKIYQFKIDRSMSDAEREKLVRDVLKLYDQYNRYFPVTAADFEVCKAMLMFNNTVRAKQQMDEIFRLFENGFSTAAASIKDANAIDLYFALCFEKFKSNDKRVTKDGLLERYILVNSMLNQLQAANLKAKEYKITSNRINALAKNIATSDNLSNYYKRKFPENKENIRWLAEGLNTLTMKNSYKPIYYILAEALYHLDHNSQSAYFMGIASVKQKKNKEAIAYYQESETLETNPLEKAKIDYSIAEGLAGSDKGNAKIYINKAIGLDPKMGKSCLLLAQIYAGSADQCCNSDFEKKAIYYLAIQTAERAIIMNPVLASEVGKVVKNYINKSLTSDDFSREKMTARTINIGCWINESLTFSGH